MQNIPEKLIKIVLIGESNTGKSEIIKKYLKLEHISKPSIFDAYRIRYNNDKYVDYNIYLNICDTSGNEEVERLIQMSYLDADIFILCIECINLKDNVYYQRMINDLKKSGKPILLAVTKVDKAKDKTKGGEYKITSNLDVVKENGKEIVKRHKLTSFVLVSVKRKKSINALFDEAVKIYFEGEEAETVQTGCFGCCGGYC